MNEARIAFLYKAASVLPAANIDATQEKLKSYYRMRCKEIAKSYGLPQKQFSQQVICTHCCLEWRRGTDIKVKSIKLSKRQRKRIKSRNKMKKHDNKVHLLHSNEIEQTCTFCRHVTKTVVSKSNKPIKVKSQQPLKQLKDVPQKKNENITVQNKQATDIYSNTVKVFSLNNKNNMLKSTVKEPKIIKNNQKKKDKFAGLCQKAVLTSARLKQEKMQKNKLETMKQNKFSLFLKPST